MKKKKGFTLIELIGIVIILGVIVIIGVPSIMKILQNNKNKEYEVFEKNLFLAAETYVSNHIDEIDELKVVGGTYYVPINLLFEEKLINSKAKYNPLTKSNVADNAAVQVIVHDDLSYDYSLTTYDPVEEEPETPPSGGGTTTPTYTVYANGTIVYFNPVTNEICDNYSTSNSKDEVKTGCLKWYIFNDNKDATTLNLLLDHNTTSYYRPTQWTGCKKDTIGDVFQAALLRDAKTWHTDIQNTVRMLTYKDVLKIVGNPDYTTVGSYYFDNFPEGSSTCEENKTSGCKYGWLYDRTSGKYSTFSTIDCTKWGCNNMAQSIVKPSSSSEDEVDINMNSVSGYELNGYWIEYYFCNSSNTYTYTPTVYYKGKISTEYSVNTAYLRFGLRPVISIQKDLVTQSS